MVWPTEYDIRLGEYDAMDLPGQQTHAAHAHNSLEHLLKLDIKSPPGCQRLTGIVTSIGKPLMDLQILEQMMSAGMNVALLNMCYGPREQHFQAIKMIQQAAMNYSVKVDKNFPIAIAACLSGRKITTGKIGANYGETVELKTGETVKLLSNEAYRESCSQQNIYISFLDFELVTREDIIYLDNKTIVLIVEKIMSEIVICKINHGGNLGSYKNVFIPSVFNKRPNYSEKDKLDIAMLVNNQIDIIIAPFVNKSEVITELRALLGEKGEKVAVVAKIQSAEGILNYDKILEVANGIMIARRELALEITPRNLITAQKIMISRANKANIPVSVSAQLLSSMSHKKLPLRAELMDIANCILDGADSLVLSAETSMGEYPIETITCLSNACKEADACIWTKQIFYELIDSTPLRCDQATGAAVAAVQAAQRIIASAVIVVTTTGKSAQLVSKYRPRCPIISVTRYTSVARRLHMWRGVIPLIYEEPPDANWQMDVERRVNFCIKFGLDQGFVRIGDPLVLLFGWRQGAGFTNTMSIINAVADIVL